MKFPKNKKYIDYIDFEYNIYNTIKHPSFNAFNKLVKYNEKYNILVGNYNPNMVTLYEYNKIYISNDHLINMYINILNILDECYEKYNFIHGDLKSNNILIDNTNPLNNIKLIDFEFSIIFKTDEIIIKDNNPLLNNYLELDDNCIIKKEFCRFFDIYTLCVDLVYNSKINLFILKEYLDKICIGNNMNSFIDFYIIYSNIYLEPKHKLIYSDTNTLNLSFKSIINNLSIIYTIGYTELLKKRILYINNILNNMMDLNLILD